MNGDGASGLVLLVMNTFLKEEAAWFAASGDPLGLNIEH